MNGSRNAVGGNATSSFDPSVKLNSQREYTRARARFKYQGGIKMNRRNALSLSSVAALGLALMAGNAIAQQKQHVSFKTPAADTKYTQQQAIDVGDVAGHQVRVYEIHRTYSGTAPMINGMRLVESWSRGITDYVDGNGPNTTYNVYVLDNGDRMFTRAALVAQSLGGGKLTTTSAGTITGGTGKLAGIQGIIRTTGTAEPKAGVNDNQTEIEYWFQK
jgi:hypothetical protein